MGSQLETFLAGISGIHANSDDFFLEKPTEIHHNSGVSAVCANYDGFLWVFPRKVIRICMNSRNSLYNAPTKRVSNPNGLFSATKSFVYCFFPALTLPPKRTPQDGTETENRKREPETGTVVQRSALYGPILEDRNLLK